MGRLAWFNIDEISAQFLRALPNQEGIMKNNIFMEGVRTFLGMESHILEPFADGNHFIGRNGLEVDGFGIAVKNTMLINRDYQIMQSMIQGVAMDMLKMAKIYALREPQNMFHGLVAPGYLKTYCEQHTAKDYVIPDIMTYNHLSEQRNGAFVKKRRIL